MRVAFLGTAEFGIPVLETLASGLHQVVGVVTGPDKPAGRGQKHKPTPVHLTARSFGFPVLTPHRFKDPDFLAAFKNWNPDVAVVVAFRILPPELFDIPIHGTLNIHPSLLPAYRGPAPINRAIINGETETGVSIIRITQKVDAGGVLLQRRIAINPDETAGELSDRIAPIGGELIVEAIEGLASGSLSPLLQDEESVTRAPKLKKEDGLIDWNNPARKLHNLVRGVTPLPGAYTLLQGKILKLFGSRISNRQGEPGEILETGDILTVACSEGALSFTEIQRQGKNRMSVSDFIRGYDLPSGTTLGKQCR